MKCIIIGLGNYGGVLAEELSALGNEVIGADINEQRVDALKDKIATAFIIDATDELSLSALPLNDVDLVIVAIGENLGASIRVVAILKQKKVKHIYARAIDSIHKAVLEAFNPDKILTPENDAAKALVLLMTLGIKVETFRIDEDYSVMKFKVPEKLIGYHVNELNCESEFNIKIIALEHTTQVKNLLGISTLEHHVDNQLPEDYVIKEGDELVCYGQEKNFLKLFKAL